MFHSRRRTTGKRAIRFLAQAAAINSSGPAVGLLADASIGTGIGLTANSTAMWVNEGAVGERAYRNGGSTELGNLAAYDRLMEGMIEVDFDLGRVWFGGGGVFVGNPAAGTSPTHTWTPGTAWTLVFDLFYPGTSLVLLQPHEFRTVATAGFDPGW
jgi:hypothetical protein